jgi:hypothetical protein
LTEAGLAEGLFGEFEAVLRKSGFTARKEQIIDASIVQAPQQRNGRMVLVLHLEGLMK